MLDVSLIGTGGMMPMPKRFLSSMMLRLNGRLFLVDCGEGTQVSIKSLGWGFKAIDAVLFTHYHADHISGLPGILLSLANSGRQELLRLIGPKGLVYVCEGLRRIAAELPFDIEYIELEEEGEKTFMLGELLVKYIFVEHSVKCAAYRFEVPRKGRFDVKRASALNIPRQLWSRLQNGKEVEFNSKVYSPRHVMGEGRRGISLSYCTDSRPIEALVDFIRDSDLFVCEGMYGEEEKKEKAIENKHMTFSEAADLAKRAEVKELWLTHFSPALSEPELFINNAAEIFENTLIGYDRMFKTIYFEQESDK